MATDIEKSQAILFDGMAELYEAHYDDPTSQAYRERFIYSRLFESVPLSGANVLEAMCGSGQTTSFLLSRGALVTGLDISSELLSRFRQRFPDSQAVNGSIFQSELPSNHFDVVAVVGGLHHLHPRVDDAVAEITRVLKPGGFLCFAEPHSGSWPDLIRRIWYKKDAHFESNEASINIKELYQHFSGEYVHVKNRYGGGIAYHLVLNSMMWRIPLRWKRYYAPGLMVLEALLSPVTAIKPLGSFILGRWQKRSVPL